MLILALDTTTRVGSCALLRDGVTVHERASTPEQSHAAHLPGDLMALLETTHVGLDAIDLFAVATGPGSFTGLRVGIATMQGLAFAMDRPLIGVSGLNALAAIGLAGRSAERDLPHRVATWVDAWRGEVYAALYEGGQEIEAPTVEHPVEVLARHGARGPVLFIGEGAATFETLIRSTLGEMAIVAEPAAPLLAGAIGALAHQLAQSGDRPSPEAIRPLYVRRIDAERVRDARPGQ